MLHPYSGKGILVWSCPSSHRKAASNGRHWMFSSGNFSTLPSGRETPPKKASNVGYDSTIPSEPPMARKAPSTSSALLANSFLSLSQNTKVMPQDTIFSLLPSSSRNRASVSPSWDSASKSVILSEEEKEWASLRLICKLRQFGLLIQQVDIL